MTCKPAAGGSEWNEESKTANGEGTGCEVTGEGWKMVHG
jgi:hypothetical protein